MGLRHIADWHLGARLYERERVAEHAVFIDWLVEVFQREMIDCLRVGGGVFDSAKTPQGAVSLCFDFLKRESLI
jgi:DNA repair protein SbcD/Mre11